MTTSRLNKSAVALGVVVTLSTSLSACSSGSNNDKSSSSHQNVAASTAAKSNDPNQQVLTGGKVDPSKVTNDNYFYACTHLLGQPSDVARKSQAWDDNAQKFVTGQTTTSWIGGTYAAPYSNLPNRTISFTCVPSSDNVNFPGVKISFNADGSKPVVTPAQPYFGTGPVYLKAAGNIIVSGVWDTSNYRVSATNEGEVLEKSKSNTFSATDGGSTKTLTKDQFISYLKQHDQTIVNGTKSLVDQAANNISSK